MLGVNRSETIGCTRPRLVFYHRALGSGFLSDPNSLKAAIHKVSDGSVVVAEAVQNLAACPGGTKLGTGRFAYSWTVGGAQAVGSYEVRWKYKTLSTDEELEYREPFEVLDDGILATRWRGYVSTQRLIDAGALKSNPTATELKNAQTAIGRVSQRIEEYTQRRFDPRYGARYLDARDVPSSSLRVGEPIVALEKVELITRGSSETATEIAASDVLVYNRHLDGLLEPDDRYQSRLESRFFMPPGIGDGVSNLESVSDLRAFQWPGGRQSVRATGVFGYRDPDETGPWGQLPVGIENAAVILASRDQKALTDPEVLEEILGRYVRPFYIGAA